MHPQCRLVLASALACLAGCATPPPPEAERHRCVVIPNGLVECSLVEPGGVGPTGRNDRPR